MALGKEEQIIFDETVSHIEAYDKVDPINRASSDMRVVRVCRYVLGFGCDIPEPLLDYHTLTGMISDEYMISVNEVNTAMGLAERRIEREQT